jgi:hypothetical protein
MLREAVLAGEFPQWNRWIGGGQPMAANPAYQVFYPLSALVLLPRFDYGFNLFLLAHVCIAAIGMYALLRSMDAGPPASAVAAASFALATTLAVHDLLPVVATLAWLPWTCLYARRFVRGGARRDFAWAALFFGVQVLLGEVAVVLQTGTILGFYALHRRGRRGVAMVALLCVAALLLAAVQVLPASDLARDSVRSRGFAFERVVSWSMPAARLGELLNPNLLGHQMLNGRAVYWGSILYGERGLPFVRSIYPGMLIAALALAGMLAGVHGRRLTCVLAVLSIVLALGSHTPLWRLLYDAGLARSIRYPEKFILMGLFAVIVFGARVLDRVLAGDQEVLLAAKRTTAAIAILLGAIAVFALTAMYAPLFIRMWNPSSRMFAEMLPASRSGWLLAAGRAALLFILLRNLSSVRRSLWLVLAGTLVLLDLGMLVPELAPRMPRAYLASPPHVAAEFHARHRDCRLMHVAAWEAPGAYSTQRPELYWINRNALYPLMPGSWGIATAVEPDFDRTSLLPTADFVDAVWTMSRKDARWADVVAAAANVCAMAMFEDAEDAFARAGNDLTAVQPVRLIDLPPSPRYSFAESMSATFGTPRSVFVRGPRFTPAPGIIRAVHETPHSARIDVETAGRAFLVMSVTPHKYWRVTIDGRRVDPVVTNIGFQGVAVPAGAHRIVMRYRNPLFAIGGAISLATAFGLLLLMRR